MLNYDSVMLFLTGTSITLLVFILFIYPSLKKALKEDKEELKLK